MRCCLPSSYDLQPLLLAQENVDTEDQNALIILDGLRELLRALTLQSVFTKRTEIEECKKMHLCITCLEPDKIGARHHLVNSKRLLIKYESQLQRKSNLEIVIEKLEESITNVALTKKLSGASLTLKQLVDATQDSGQLMDGIQNSMAILNDQTDKLSQSQMIDNDDIDAELSQLMCASMPSVPVSSSSSTIVSKKVKNAE